MYSIFKKNTLKQVQMLHMTEARHGLRDANRLQTTFDFLSNKPTPNINVHDSILYIRDILYIYIYRYTYGAMCERVEHDH